MGNHQGINQNRPTPYALFKRYVWGEGQKRELSGRLLTFQRAAYVLTAVYILSAVLLFPNQISHRSIGFGIFFALAFIKYQTPGVKKTNDIPPYDWLLAIGSLSVSVYIESQLDRLLSRTPFVDSVLTLDMLFFALTMILLLEGTRRVVGPWISFISILAVVYAVAGQYLSGRFSHPGFSVDDIVDELFMTTYGIWGGTLGIAVDQIAIFIIFGSFLVKSGVGTFLYEIAAAIAGKSRGGLAKVAVLTSALFGTISGSAVANTSTMGVITIPMMKKNGYSAEFAAALESCASVGGIFMPPIMGSVAFIMAEVAGLSYRSVAMAAIIPAVLYFTALFLTVDARALKTGLKGLDKEDTRAMKTVLLDGFHYLIPIGYLVLRLMSGISPSRVGLESIAVVLLASLLRRHSRMTLMTWIKALADGIGQSIMIVTTMGCCGIMIGIINLTGVSSKFSSLLILVSGDSKFLSIILVMGLAIFLGLAMNITPAYLLSAVAGAPILINLGVVPIAAHMFILFYAAMATITPPVALTAFTAAAIADAPPMRVSFLAMRIGILAYLLPIAFVLHPALLLSGTATEILAAAATGLFAVAAIAYGLEGWLLAGPIKRIARIILVLAGLLALFGSGYAIALSIVLVAVVAIPVLLKSNHKEKITESKEIMEEINDEKEII